MQSTKKSNTSPVPRSVTYAYSVSNKNAPRKKNASSQTDKTVPFEEQPDLKAALKDEFTFDENTKKTYFKALDYINKIHNCMNKKLYEKYGECGDIEPEASRFFKLPNIPNYSTVYLMLLEKTRSSKITEKVYKPLKKENNIKTDFDAHKGIGKTTVIELVPDIVNLTEYNILEQNAVFNENVQQVQNRSNGITRNVFPLRFETMEDTDDDYAISEEPSEFRARHTEENINYVQQVVIYSTKNGFSEEESTVENENSSASDKECCSIFEGIKNEDEGQKIILEEQDAVKHVENKTQYDKQCLQNDKTNINDTDKNDYTEKNVIIDVIKQRVQEEFLTYLNATNLNLSRVNNDKKARLAKSNFQGVNIQPQTNLLEYAQKKLERKHNFERETKSAESERPHKQYFNNFLLSRNSASIKPCAPEKVTNLFRKISQEKFNYDNAKHGDRGYDFQNVDTPSDNDSVILDDEEFERMSKCHYREEIKMDEVKPISSGITDHTYEKSHPLKLNGKDMSNLNEKVLSAIGLFTERGDIRPGIIDILEEEKRAKAQDSRNKQFRARRQWDLQIHLQPKQDMNSITSVSTEKSFISLSSDIKSDFETVKNISHQMETLKK